MAGQQNTIGFDDDAGNGFGGGLHQVEIDFQGSATQLNDFTISYDAWQPVGNVTLPFQAIPNTGLDPNYGLKTSSTDPDGVTTTTSYSNAAIGPEYGLPAATTVGSGSSTPLTTTMTYEAPGAGSFLRRLSSALPGGATTTLGYYTGDRRPGGRGVRRVGQYPAGRHA